MEGLASALDENKKEALAEYVLHRKSVIELVETARKFRPDDGRTPEDVIHKLVFRRYTDNVEASYFALAHRRCLGLPAVYIKRPDAARRWKKDR